MLFLRENHESANRTNSTLYVVVRYRKAERGYCSKVSKQQAHFVAIYFSFRRCGGLIYGIKNGVRESFREIWVSTLVYSKNFLWCPHIRGG
jgi:hypothetical protein